MNKVCSNASYRPHILEWNDMVEDAYKSFNNKERIEGYDKSAPKK